MNNINLNSFHKYLRTTKESGEFLTLVTKIQAELFRSNGTFEQLLEKDIPYDLAMSLKKAVDQANLDIANKTQMESFLTKLREKVAALPAVGLMLPFSPKKLFIEAVSDWFYKTFEKVILLDITVNTSLIAGGVIRYNGLQKDYSLRKQILGE